MVPYGQALGLYSLEPEISVFDPVPPGCAEGRIRQLPQGQRKEGGFDLMILGFGGSHSVTLCRHPFARECSLGRPRVPAAARAARE